MRALLGFLLVVLSGPTLGLARDIYVDNVNGDDRQGGQSPQVQGDEGGPCRSITKALRIARPGDRIVVANSGVPYRECLTIQGPQHSGDDDFPLHLSGNGATLDGTMSLADAKWEHFRREIFRTQPARMSYQQLFIDEQPAVRRQPAAGQPPELGPREWCLVDGWLYFRCDKDRLPQAYNLACCLHPVGVTLYNVHDVIVENLNIRGFYLDGVNCHDNVTRSDLLGVTSSHNGRSGFSVGGASRVRIDTCTAAGNGAAQVRTEGYSVTVMVENQLDATSAPAIVKEGGRVVQE
jgi:parallel beta helix pectate lyase-like protein